MPMIIPLPQFTPPPGKVIAMRPAGGNVYPKTLDYTLRVDTGVFHFFLEPTHGRPPNAVDDTYLSLDHSLDMRVYENVRISLTLDDDLTRSPAWCFPMLQNVIILGDASDGSDPLTRYRNLEFLNPVSIDTCKTVAFDADHYEVIDHLPLGLGHWKKNRDQFNFTIHLPQQMADRKTADTALLALLIDPGIKNPGDDP